MCMVQIPNPIDFYFYLLTYLQGEWPPSDPKKASDNYWGVPRRGQAGASVVSLALVLWPVQKIVPFLRAFGKKESRKVCIQLYVRAFILSKEGRKEKIKDVFDVFDVLFPVF